MNQKDHDINPLQLKKDVSSKTKTKEGLVMTSMTSKTKTVTAVNYKQL